MSATAEMERLEEFFEDGFKMDGESPSGGSGEMVINGVKGSQGENEGDAEMPEVSGEGEAEEWSGFSTSDEDTEEPKVNGTNDHDDTIGRKPSVNGINGVKEIRATKLTNGQHSSQGQENSNATHTTSGKDSVSKSRVATCHIEGRQYPVQIHYLPEPTQDYVDAALRTIFQIHHKEPLPGDILVFVTGQETVEALEALVKDYAVGLSPELPKILVLPLFAALPQPAQQQVFQSTPPKTRKVVIATNIAETSVTISGVRFVIDCGKAKMKQFRSRIGLESLLVKPISKSAAIQRKGRAGREAPGQCYRLYTEQDYLQLQDSNAPEILRCDLSHSILVMKARGADDVLNFPFLDQPSRDALEKALLQLLQLKALDESGAITEIGLRIAKFPLSVPLGRTLLAASEGDVDCISEVIDIISCLTVENVFLNVSSEEQKEEAEAARRDLVRREGDHLTLLATVRAYAREKSDRKSWATRHFVSHRAMQSVMDVRKQLRAQSQQTGALKVEDDASDDSAVPSSDLATAILKAFLTGLALNTARLCPDGSYKTLVGNQTVAIHPSSGLFGRKVEAIMYNEFVFTNRSYARGVSAVQMDWIGDVMGV